MQRYGRPALLASALLLGGCGAGPEASSTAGGAAAAPPSRPGGGAAPDPGAEPPPDGLRPEDGWWREGDEACPDGGHIERREERGGRVYTCKTGAFPHGPQIAWYQDGARRWQRTHLDGELHGLWVRWYSSGKKRAEVSFAGGERHGLARTWAEDGNVVSRSRWHRGQLRERTSYKDGAIQETVRYHPNGHRAAVIPYRDGARHGTASAWHEDGKIARRGDYRHGKKDGAWTYMDTEGNVLRTETYEEGELVAREEGGEVPAARSSSETGIEACDDYLRLVEQYLSCDKVPDSVRKAQRRAIAKLKERWDRDDNDPARQKKTCEQGLRALRQAAKASGCALGD